MLVKKKIGIYNEMSGSTMFNKIGVRVSQVRVRVITHFLNLLIILHILLINTFMCIHVCE